MSVIKKVGMFLYILAFGASNKWVFVYAVASAFKANRVNQAFGNIRKAVFYLVSPIIFSIKLGFCKSS